MKILCAYSGIQFNVDHFPASLNSRECYHPIFAIPQKKLLQYTIKWAARELTDTDKYLLFLALMNSTELLEWRVPAIRTSHTNSLIEQNMESLVQMVGRINLINHPSFVLSKIAITPETKDLNNCRYWIRNWQDSYAEFLNGYKESKLHDRIVHREQRLQSLIKDENKPLSHYAKILADWANDAAEFPSYLVTVNFKQIPIAEYWKEMIISCCKEERIFQIPKEHLEKLIEYCEDNLDAGSIYAHTLFGLLRSGLKKQSNYLGLGDIDLSESFYRILPEESSIEDANRLAMIDSAPLELPIESKYPSKLAYLRAKVKWDMKIEWEKQQVVAAKIQVAVEEDIEEAEDSEAEGSGVNQSQESQEEELLVNENEFDNITENL